MKKGILPNRRIWFSISGALFLSSIVVIAVWGLPLGIDFAGGILVEAQTPRSGQEIRQLLTERGVQSSVQESGQRLLIRMLPSIDIDAHELVNSVIGEEGSVQRFETVGPAVSRTLQKKALVAIGVASLAIIIYLAWAFRTVSRFVSPLTFGVIAVIALIHDLIIMTGSFAVLGHLVTAITVDAYFITALLTIMGYSVNDTIVIFDRIRENLKSGHSADLAITVESGVMQTLSRSVNTSMTVVFVIVPLLLIGSGPLLSFLTALLIGVVVGTYSSIFLAAPLLVVWQSWRISRRR